LVPKGWVLGSLGVCDADRTEAVLRKRASAFHHLQLLPAIASIENQPRARCICTGISEAPRADGFSLDRLCSNARACALADQRTEARYSVHGVAENKAAGIAKIAQANQGRSSGADTFAVPRRGTSVEPFLARAILRFQRI